MSTFKKVVAARLRKKGMDGLTFADIVAALQDLNGGEKQRMLNSVVSLHRERIGSLVLLAVNSKLESDAEAEADDVLADGVVSSAEMDKIF
jgi:hypothetical protein